MTTHLACWFLLLCRRLGVVPGCQGRPAGRCLWHLRAAVQVRLDAAAFALLVGAARVVMFCLRTASNGCFQGLQDQQLLGPLTCQPCIQPLPLPACSLEGSTLTRLGSLTCPSLDGGGADVAAAVTAVDCTADGRNVFMGTADGGVWLADVNACTAEEGRSGSSSGALSSSHQRPVLLQRQPAEVAGLSWDHPWLAVADRAGNMLLLDAGTCTAAGVAAVEGSGGAAASAAGRRSKKQLALTSRVLFSASMGGAGAAAQCVCLDGTWAAAGLDCGTALSFDGSKGQQQLAAAAAARAQKAERRQRNVARQQQQRGGKGSGGGSSSTKRSQPVPIPPRPTQARQTEQQQQQQQQQAGEQPDSQQPPLSSSRGRSMLGRSPSACVPPPLPPEALAAAGSCRQQAWHVLRPARSAGAGAEGSSVGPAPQQ